MRSRVRFDLAFLDMVFNLVLAFAFLFLMSFLLIRPTAEPPRQAVEMKAEFVITMSWPDGSLDDQDLWVKMPDGKLMGYSLKDLGVATLDRDDRGGHGNIYYDPADGVRKIQPLRREVVTIRAIIPGRYVVNVHTFNSRDSWQEFQSAAVLPYDVEATMVKLNPRVEDITKVKSRMEKQGDQRTLFAFTVAADGKVVEVETDVDEPFVPQNGKVEQ
jgi:hypothetical protein